MIINNIKMYNFRCFSEYFLCFSQGVNIIFGSNAAGKTSILEALSYAGVTKSFKTNNESEMIKDGNKEMAVIVKVERKSKTKEIYKIQKTINGKCVIKNDFKYSKISDFIGNILIVSFCNYDLINLLGSPKERRKIFEPIFCQISNEYLETCNYYQRVLKERNALLKRLIIEKSDKLLNLLKTLNEQLVDNGIKIIKARKKFINRLNEKNKKYHNLFSEEKEEVEIIYQPSVTEEMFRTELNDNIENDIKKGTTTIGPHRDDYLFFVNKKNIVIYGSQGQQRSCLISLKLTFVDELKEVKGESPILLLDDIFSELDKDRQNNLLKLIDYDIQTFISTATLADVDKGVLNKSNIITLIKEE